MKNIFKFIFLFILSIQITNANDIQFYGEKDISWGFDDVSIEKIKEKIDYFQDKTGLNSDIVILGKNDEKNCYLDSNFDSCVVDKYGYASDLVVVLKMKSDISSRGDIRSYMNDKNYPYITTQLLKQTQDSIVYHFSSNNFVMGLIGYYNNLHSKILIKCKDLKSYNKSNGGSKSSLDCSIGSYKEILEENKIINDKNNIILKYKLEKEKIIREQEVEKENLVNKLKLEKRLFMINMYIIMLVFLLLLTMVGLYIYYRGRLSKLLGDIKFRYIDINDSDTFEVDKEIAKKSLKSLIKQLEKYLGNADKNPIKLRNQYAYINYEFEKVEKKLRKAIKNYLSQKKLKKKIDKIKNTNI